MQFWSRILAGLHNLLRKEQIESQLDEEVRAYVDLLADDKNRSRYGIIQSSPRGDGGVRWNRADKAGGA